ncbi:nucleotide pyrophosphohydrolase [Sideroxydans sp.]
MSDKRLEKIKVGLRQFAEDRDWDQFHSPKNLSMALIAEAAELVEHFQWLTEDQSNNLNQKQLEEVAMEMADVQIYLLRLAEKLELDILSAVEKKMEINAKKYPAEIVKGSSKKYTEYK